MIDHIKLSITGATATITLDRPDKLNAMTPDMATAMIDCTNRINSDDTVRAVILTGAGDRAFCAGSDIEELDDYDTPWQFRNRPDYCDAMQRLLKPCIAAINGYTFGGGLEMAMACDIRLAAHGAKIGAPEVKLGWIGGGGMAVQLAHSIGPSNAALMIMTGDPISAEQAWEWGLVSEVLPPSDLLDRANVLAETIAKRAPIAAETARVNLKAAFSMPLQKAIEYERDLQTICFATEDATEGRRAFVEKRAPNFKRR